MIFSPALARAVVAGRKTQTRRLVKGNCRYKVGHDYAVQPGRGKPAVARVKVLDVREEYVGDITHAAAKAEGFRNAAAFKAYWVRIHDANWVARCDEPSELDLCARFERRHAHRLVHVLTFEVLRDAPRFMATQRDILTGRSEGDYTSRRQRAIDDLECVDATTQARYAKVASTFGEEQRASFRSDLEAERARRKAERGRMSKRAA